MDDITMNEIMSGQTNEREYSIFDEQVSRKPNRYPWTDQFIQAMHDGFWTDKEFNFKSDVQQFKVNLTDQEREILILILYKCQLDDFLSVDTKKLLYQDFNINTIDNTKLKQKERAKFLGFPLYKFKKNTDTLLKKTKKILLTSGFKEEIRYLEKQVNLNNV